MPIKPVGLGAGNKFTVADDGSALTGLDAVALRTASSTATISTPLNWHED